MPSTKADFFVVNVRSLLHVSGHFIRLVMSEVVLFWSMGHCAIKFGRTHSCGVRHLLLTNAVAERNLEFRIRCDLSLIEKNSDFVEKMNCSIVWFIQAVTGRSTLSLGDPCEISPFEELFCLLKYVLVDSLLVWIMKLSETATTVVRTNDPNEFRPLPW